MAGLKALRLNAIKAGVSQADARKAKSEAQLNNLIQGVRDFETHGGKDKKVAVKKAVTKSAPAKRGRPAKAKPVAKAEPKRRGRPPGKATASKVTKKVTSSTEGRNMLNGIDWGEHKDWNPRKDSPPDRIIRMARKYKGNREKIFEALKSDVNDFINKKKLNGQTRDKAEMLNELKNRISQTMWFFATKTGQHKKSTKRADYGTAGKGTGAYVRGYGGRASHLAPRGKRKAAAKPAQTPSKGRGRPKGSTTKAKPGRPAKRTATKSKK